jgi:phosphoenolpyruvate synthase/pyruvate phosphate dikinase
MTDYIRWLNTAEAEHVHATGGKGASLARLGAGGFPVPPGFVLTVSAYDDFHGEAGLTPSVEMLASLDQRPPMDAVHEAAQPILDLLAEAKLPETPKMALGKAFSELRNRAGDGATFAVRSSGVSEDGATNSFAGLYETFLNLTDFDSVYEAVEACYGCLWHPRAIHYRTIKGLDHGQEKMAVVVMQTVEAHSAGVAFSMNPVTGASDEVLINASFGLGESVVSGIVTPDNYIAGKDGTITEKQVSQKLRQIVRVAGGTEERTVPPEIAGSPALSDEQIATVANTTAEVERQYGLPVDIEFAFDAAGDFFLLQARPITTV